MFETVYGHARIKKILTSMVEKDGLHHALCFFGPSGIGKRLTARELAKAMLCETRTGCGSCTHCHKFDHGNHPDYTEIEPAGNDIKVDQIRQISENLHFRPFEAAVRVIVLDQAERMREEAANAFLKSLEEPPDYVYFVLVCTDLKALLPTIRSRCQKMPFQSLNLDDKVGILQSRVGKDEAVARKLASISFRQLETDEQAWQLFEGDMGTIVKYFQMMTAGGHAIDYLVDLLRDKAVFPRFMDHLMAAIRELALRAQGLPGQPIYAAWDKDLNALVAKSEPGHWRELMEQLLNLQGGRRRNLNASMWFNALSVSGLGLRERSAREIKQRLARR